MPSSYLNCFYDGCVPEGNSGNLRPDTYDYKSVAKRITKLISLNKEDRVLDMGCGNGLFADQIIGKVKSITLLEANPALVDFLYKKYTKGEVDISDQVIYALPFKDESFDKIICNSVLQYCDIEEARKAIKEAYRVCKKDGMIFFGDVFDSAVIHDTRDGMGSFNPKELGRGYNYKTLLSNYEPEKRYDLIIKK